MSWLGWTALVAGGYLLGSVSWSYLMMRWKRGEDIRKLGSGNAGATNVLRALGLAPALVVLALDLGKGAAPAAVAVALEAPGPVVGATAVAAVVGHVFPVFLGFRGGKGVAPVAGAMFCLAPVPAALGLAVFLGLVVPTRWVALGSVCGVGLFPVLVYVCGRLGWAPPAPPWLLLSAAILAVLIVFRHRENILSIRDGKEWKLGRTRSEEEI